MNNRKMKERYKNGKTERNPSPSSSYAAFFRRRNNNNKPVHVWSGAAAQSSKEKEEIGWDFVWRKTKAKAAREEKKRDEKKKSNSIRKKSEEFKWAIIITSNRTTAHNSLVSKSTLPELGCIGFRDAKLIAGEDTVGKDGFKFAKHMREDETQFC
jgi:hypothetical protein